MWYYTVCWRSNWYQASLHQQRKFVDSIKITGQFPLTSLIGFLMSTFEASFFPCIAQWNVINGLWSQLEHMHQSFVSTSWGYWIKLVWPPSVPPLVVTEPVSPSRSFSYLDWVLILTQAHVTASRVPVEVLRSRQVSSSRIQTGQQSGSKELPGTPASGKAPLVSVQLCTSFSLAGLACKPMMLINITLC